MKILIADDEEVSRLKLESQLTGWGHEVVSAADGDEAWRLLQRLDGPRLAILDWMMPGLDGPALCKKLREFRRETYVYVILLTARTGKPDIVAGLEAGADDYISKPFEPQELRLRVRAGQRILELQEALQTQASRDALTGLWNRRAILDMLDRELARGARTAVPVGVLMVDLDHFKRINDAHGHLVGDAVLQQMARRMVGVVRPYDRLGRMGGEEFLIVLPRCDLAETGRIAERLRLSIAGSPAETTAGKIPVTASIGVASVAGENDGTRPLLQAADEALYRAKNEGRNCVRVAGQMGVYAS